MQVVSVMQQKCLVISHLGQICRAESGEVHQHSIYNAGAACLQHNDAGPRLSITPLAENVCKRAAFAFFSVARAPCHQKALDIDVNGDDW